MTKAWLGFAILLAKWIYDSSNGLAKYPPPLANLPTPNHACLITKALKTSFCIIKCSWPRDMFGFCLAWLGHVLLNIFDD